MAIFSSKQKLALSGWFYENNEKEYHSSLKLQKFLFFYESFCFNDGKENDFKSLQGWKDGPVFGTVYGDYTYRPTDFLSKAITTYKELSEKIDRENALLSNFVVSIMNKEELSLFTHEFNIWKKAQRRIENGESGVVLYSKSFNEKDFTMLSEMKSSYSTEFITSTEIISVGEKIYIMDAETKQSLSKQHKEVLEKLSINEMLINPVYVDLNEEGVLVVD